MMIDMPASAPSVDPSVLIVMGVSGSGKTTIGTKLAERLHWPCADGDQFHPQSNIDKMHSGHPLTDEDRWPWLRAIAAYIDGIRAKGECAVITCSALKRAYRDILIGDRADVRLVYLKGERDLIAKRLASRHGHFMPPGLLDSQFAALEPPSDDEHPIIVSIDATPDAIVDTIVEALPLAASLPVAGD
jgi:carbohydrate kinase (thermoresistant glucokinase family)